MACVESLLLYVHARGRHNVSVRDSAHADLCRTARHQSSRAAVECADRPATARLGYRATVPRGHRTARERRRQNGACLLNRGGARHFARTTRYGRAVRAYVNILFRSVSFFNKFYVRLDQFEEQIFYSHCSLNCLR